MIRLMPLVLLLLLMTTAPAWASGACCAVNADRGVAASVETTAVSGLSANTAPRALVAWSPDVLDGAGCPCCPPGDDCQSDRCCGSAVAGSMVTGPPPFRVVLRPTAGSVPVFTPHAASRAIARDARPPISLPR